MTIHDNTLLELLISKIDAIDAKLEQHMTDEEKKIGELLEAWNTAKGIVWFVKAAAGVVTVAALTWAWVTSHFVIGVK